MRSYGGCSNDLADNVLQTGCDLQLHGAVTVNLIIGRKLNGGRQLAKGSDGNKAVYEAISPSVNSPPLCSGESGTPMRVASSSRGSVGAAMAV